MAEDLLGPTESIDAAPKQGEARERLAFRLQREFRPRTEHGDEVELADYDATQLADIIAEYVSACLTPKEGTWIRSSM
ncbi:hypothetical protein FJ434_16470 [Mesorhizobium sp. B2-5-13]|uniref:hypothetical protein n=1 Tax=unclassified Mesorhizobium TaxID=325217 RepID=UPI00112A2C1D|nr:MULTISPECIES: hypothetical protein [unclassified Mesorhizobium]TPJ85519.1 hypothetical protein FJ434_16470 [Mesorhizobium sp. B2-5-13]TPK39269.1 hypothetical protein FJ560_29390 [Mesorhizobium sp. B2-5-5]